MDDVQALGVDITAARRQREALPRSHKITSLLLARARGFVKKEGEFGTFHGGVLDDGGERAQAEDCAARADDNYLGGIRTHSDLTSPAETYFVRECFLGDPVSRSEKTMVTSVHSVVKDLFFNKPPCSRKE